MKKAHANYWLGRLKRNQYRVQGTVRECGGWSVQMQAAGRRQRVTLTRSGKHQAAAQAAEFYQHVKVEGWDSAIKWLNPDSQAGRETTVGSLIAHVEGLGVVQARTLSSYAYALRWFAKQHLGMDGDESRFDAKGGGNAAWRAGLDGVPLRALTPQVVQRIVDRYVKTRSKDPLEERKASTSARTLIRCARSLFSKRLLKRIALPLPSPLPFAGIELPAAPPTRYVSTVNVGALIEAGRAELRGSDRAVWISILLGLMAGLRKGEMDRLTWSHVRWNESKIWIATTVAGAAKTQASEGLVRVHGSLLEELRAWQANGAPADWVLPGREAMPTDSRDYRCDSLFGRALVWLRQHGVEGEKPLHLLRKEYGSYVAQTADLITAAHQLRHANIATTAAFYVEPRRVVTPSLGDFGAKGVVS